VSVLTVPPPTTEEAQGLRSVSIAASVLDCFAAHAELGATQVARELGVAKSTACRMLSGSAP
jgi:IclR family transcriptional regulator, KDG regulon repressor